MIDLFTLSIIKLDLVYHREFIFSIDSYRLDQFFFWNKYSTLEMNRKRNLYQFYLSFL